VRPSQNAESTDESPAPTEFASSTAARPRDLLLQRAAIRDWGAMIVVVALILIAMEITSRYVPPTSCPRP
jgi:hypothetical protein